MKKKVVRARPSRPAAKSAPVPAFDPDDNPLWGLPRAAKRLGVSAHTVRKLTRRGLRWTKIGREIKFKPEWIEDFIEAGGR